MFTVSVPWGRVSSSVVGALEEVIRPTSLAEAHERLNKAATDESAVAYWRELIETGQVVGSYVATVTEPSGVVHSGMEINSLPLELVDGATNSSVIVKSAFSLQSYEIRLESQPWGCTAEIHADASKIEQFAVGVRAILEGTVDQELVARMAPPFKVFLGHGSDPQWKYLRRMLEESHGFVVEAFESMERAGYHTLVVVDQMVRSSHVAVVILTGEDRMEDGSLRARENVIHEVGFCQGVLGIDRTIVVMEEGVSEPSNIAGLTQIRFKRGSVIDAEAQIVEALRLRKDAFEYSVR